MKGDIQYFDSDGNIQIPGLGSKEVSFLIQSEIGLTNITQLFDCDAGDWLDTSEIYKRIVNKGWYQIPKGKKTNKSGGPWKIIFKPSEGIIEPIEVEFVFHDSGLENDQRALLINCIEILLNYLSIEAKFIEGCTNTNMPAVQDAIDKKIQGKSALMELRGVDEELAGLLWDAGFCKGSDPDKHLIYAIKSDSLLFKPPEIYTAIIGKRVLGWRGTLDIYKKIVVMYALYNYNDIKTGPPTLDFPPK